MTTLPAKVYTRIGRTPRQLRLVNQIIMDSKNEEAYTNAIHKLQQERQRIKQRICDSLIALEESERTQTLSQEPRIVKGLKPTKQSSKLTKQQYLKELGWSKTDIAIVMKISKDKKGGTK